MAGTLAGVAEPSRYKAVYVQPSTVSQPHMCTSFFLCFVVFLISVLVTCCAENVQPYDKTLCVLISYTTEKLTKHWPEVFRCSDLNQYTVTPSASSAPIILMKCFLLLVNSKHNARFHNTKLISFTKFLSLCPAFSLSLSLSLEKCLQPNRPHFFRDW